MLQSQQIKDLRKSGHLEESLQLALQDLEANADNIYAKRNISWVYNDLLKKYGEEENLTSFIGILNKVKDLNMPETDTMLFDNIAWKIGSLFFKVIKYKEIPYDQVYKIVDLAKLFHYSKPSEAYSFLLKATHKVLKTNRDKYIAFIDWWNTDYLSEEDYKKDVLPKGNQMMSVAEQVFTAYFKFLIPSANYQLERQTVLENVRKIDEVYEKNHSFIYLVYFKVQMLLAIGERNHLLTEFLPFAQKKSREFWVWDLLHQIVQTEEDKVTCLCMACLSGYKVEQMKTNIYLKIAEYFISKNMFSEAKSEILKIQKIKNENAQKIPSKVMALVNSDWFSACEATVSNESFYKSNAKNADAILFSNLPSEDIFVYNINPDKKIINFIKGNDDIGFFKHDRLNPHLKINVGDILNVRFSQFSKEHPSKLFTLKKGENSVLKDKNFKIEAGSVRLNEKGFAFLNDSFISPTTVQKLNLLNKQDVTAISIRRYNRKKKSLAWEILKLA